MSKYGVPGGLILYVDFHFILLNMYDNQISSVHSRKTSATRHNCVKIENWSFPSLGTILQKAALMFTILACFCWWVLLVWYFGRAEFGGRWWIHQRLGREESIVKKLWSCDINLLIQLVCIKYDGLVNSSVSISSPCNCWSCSKG